MTKINIISGFLGAGKTTFIKRLIEDVFKGEKLVLIENEFGEIGVDGGFLQDAGVQINEMVSGCICCSLVGDFTAALNETVNTYAPDRILIEPSGVGKLSDVIAAVQNTGRDDIVIDACITVVDCTKCRMYRKNFGEFYEDQLKNAACVLLSRTDKASPEKLAQALDIIRDINPDVSIITTPLSQLAPEQIVDALNKGLMEKELLAEALRVHEEHEHHHHHEHGEHCTCGCHDHDHEHHHEHDEHDHHEHHHDHDEHCECHEHHHDHDEHDHHEHHHDHDEHDHHEHHHHHHEHGEHCTCGCHDHHHADDTFTSWGFETARVYAREEIEAILAALDSGDYGMILRAKGMVNGVDGWIYFDYVPEESGVRSGSPCFTGRICVIGVDLDEDKLAELFHKSH